MGRSADHLLKLIYEWLEEAEECSSNLRGLARELESLRRDCNAWETVGNTVAVAGSLLALCAAPFTGGASLAAAGALAGGIGAGVSVVTKITEGFKSSSKLERVKKIDKRCNQISDEIQELFKELRQQCPSSSTEDRDKHVVNEFLKAMSRRSGLDKNIDIKDLDDLIKQLMDNAVVKHVSKSLASSLIMDTLSVLTAFSLELEGKVLSAAAAAGGKQIGKTVAIKGVSRFLGGVVGLAFSLPEAIDSWTEAIKDKHETKASKSLRDTAEKIDEAAESLSRKLSQIKGILQNVTTKPRPTPAPAPDPPSDDDDKSSSEEETESSSSSSSSSSESESSSDDEDTELKMALINARSANKFISRQSSALIDLILDHDLDVLLITETWLPLNSVTNSDFRSTLPPNYIFINDPRFYGRGGGVAIVFSPAFVVRHVYFNFPFTFEYSAASMRRRKTDEPILILNIYRPPARRNIRDFLDELRVLLSMAFLSFRNVVIGGDFNIWVDRPDLAESRDFQTLLSDFGLVQHVSEETHGGGHTLDLVIARPDVGIPDLSVQPNSFSDHRTVFFTVNVRPLNASDITRCVKKMVSLTIKKKKKKQKKRKRKKLDPRK